METYGIPHHFECDLKLSLFLESQVIYVGMYKKSSHQEIYGKRTCFTEMSKRFRTGNG